MVVITPESRVPNQPFLNQNFYVVFSFNYSTFTGAFCSIASVVAPIKASGSSFVAIYPAGSVATGTWPLYAYAVKATTAGSYDSSKTIKIRNSEIADPAKTLYDTLRNNVGTTYASTNFSTGWYSATSSKPQVTVTRGGRTDETWNVGDTFRRHDETLYVDTWVPDNSPASAFFGATGYKNALTLLDDEVKRIINSTRFTQGTKLWHAQIVRSMPLDEVTDPRRIFRTRHTVRIIWGESIA